MRFEGTVEILAPREKVWKFLTDADFVAKCAPGLEEMKIVVPNEKYFVVAKISFGSIVAVFRTDVTFQEMKEPDFAMVKAHGDTLDSAVDATSEMALSDGVDGTTELKWTADIVVVGKIASTASRMMSSVTKKLANQFFECFKNQVEI
jgi:carbon monoxide dehydrogenase subunit G